MKNILVGLALSATIIACSSDDDNSGNDGNTNDSAITNEVSNTRNTGFLDSIELTKVPDRVGFLQIGDFDQASIVGAFGVFVEWPEDAGTDVSRLFESDIPPGESCAIEAVNINDEETFEDHLSDNFELISAGDALTLTSDAGTYGTMEKLETLIGLTYLSTSGPVFPSPDSLTISIPGEAFSMMEFVTQRPEAIVGFSLPLDSVLQENATLTWEASTQNETLISISFIDVSGNSTQLVGNCLLIDDGEFTVPSSLHVEAVSIAGEDVSLEIVAVSRIRVESVEAESTNDAVIYVRSVDFTE